MKQILISIFALITLTSFQADISGPWIITENDKIVLYSRPQGYSITTSPDSNKLQKIIQEQEQIIYFINERLKTNFDIKVEIYLFNYDEAVEKIGTNGGGFCSTKKPKIYFTYCDTPLFNTIRNTYEYVGVHEMVHLIVKYKLGKPKTQFFAEGYANAIDGNYGSVKDGDKLIRQRNDITIKKFVEKGELLTPSELLKKNEFPESVYYPQIGCLINWLFEEYGVEKINRLYTFDNKKVEKRFSEITGDTFNDMETKYLKHQDNQ